jgi:hypothetical protein
MKRVFKQGIWKEKEGRDAAGSSEKDSRRGRKKSK